MIPRGPLDPATYPSRLLYCYTNQAAINKEQHIGSPASLSRFLSTFTGDFRSTRNCSIFVAS